MTCQVFTGPAVVANSAGPMTTSCQHSVLLQCCAAAERPTTPSAGQEPDDAQATVTQKTQWPHSLISRVLQTECDQ